MDAVPVTVDTLVDSAVALSLEAQTAFAETYAGLSWRAELTDEPRFWFEREPAPTFRPHFIGSTSDRAGTWLWGWENVNGFGAEVVAAAERVRAVAVEHGLAELLSARVPSAPGDTAVPHRHLLVAQAVTGIPTYYRAPFGTGTFCWLLVDNPAEFRLPPATAVSAAGALARAAGSGMVTHGSFAVAEYARRREGVVLRSADPRVAVLDTDSGSVEVTFDELGRIAGVAAEQSEDGAVRPPTGDGRRGLLRRRAGRGDDSSV